MTCGNSPSERVMVRLLRSPLPGVSLYAFLQHWVPQERVWLHYQCISHVPRTHLLSVLKEQAAHLDAMYVREQGLGLFPVLRNPIEDMSTIFLPSLSILGLFFLWAFPQGLGALLTQAEGLQSVRPAWRASC